MISFLAAALLAAVALPVGYTLVRTRQIRGDNRAGGTFTRIDGVRLHYHLSEPEGTGRDLPVLVFLHGASGNALDLKLAFEAGLRHRYRLLFVDRPGLGFSERGGARHQAVDAQARLIAGLLEALSIDGAVVVGHSLGAAVAAALGLAAPGRVRALAFLAPASHPWPGGVAWYYSLAAVPLIGWLFCRTLTLPVAERLAAAAMENVFAPEPAPEGYAEAIRVPLLFRPDSFRANAEQIAMLKPSLEAQSPLYPGLMQPAVIVTGTRDTVVWPSIHSEGLLRDLPQAELVVLDGAGHMPQHTRTDDCVAALERLVRRAAEAAPAAPERADRTALQPA